MDMHDPAHPGEVIREVCLKPLNLTVTAAAAALGVTRKAFSDLLNGHGGGSPEMAIRLEKVGWSQADFWLRMQLQRDLWVTRQRSDKIVVRARFPAAARSGDSFHAVEASLHRTFVQHPKPLHQPQLVQRP